MRKSLFALLVVGAMLAAGAASAQRSNRERVEAMALRRFEGAVTVHYSPEVSEAAAFYRSELEAAVLWFRREAGWTAEVRAAVLSKGDFPRATTIPYPTPHAETATGFIILADRVEEHPGFELWDLDGRFLNAAWGVHELGHVLARDLGIASANPWVGELLANIFMAAYVRAERPAFAGFQSGLPPRFRGPFRYSRLAELDELYFSMGQENYLWFQFEIARLAGYLAGEKGLSALILDLKREFPAARRARETVSSVMARLERIRPGVTVLAGSLGRD